MATVRVVETDLTGGLSCGIVTILEFSWSWAKSADVCCFVWLMNYRSDAKLCHKGLGKYRDRGKPVLASVKRVIYTDDRHYRMVSVSATECPHQKTHDSKECIELVIQRATNRVREKRTTTPLHICLLLLNRHDFSAESDDLNLSIYHFENQLSHSWRGESLGPLPHRQRSPTCC